MTTHIDVLTGFDNNKPSLFLLLPQWSVNGAAAQSQPLSLNDALDLSEKLQDAVKDVLRDIVNRPGVKSCVCGCGAPWYDPESDEYLDTHVECDSCGDDFSIDEALVERVRGYPDGEIYTRYYCPVCCDNDDSDEEQPAQERLQIDLTLEDL